MDIGTCKKECLDAVDRTAALLSEVEGGEVFTERLAQTRSWLENCRFALPVIGEFSAGKSSMLNGLIGRHILPTAITPATALPMELWQGAPERIEAVDTRGNSAVFSLEAIGQLSQEADKWVYGRMYLENTALGELAPFFLVDMPGTSSPNEAHNEAILRYLEKGVHYIVVIDVSKGTPGANLLRRLREIADTGKRFHVFLSKADLVPEKNIQAAADFIKALMKENFDFNVAVTVLPPSFDSSLLAGALDPAAIYRNIAVPPVAELLNDVLNFCNIQESALKRKEGELNDIMADLQAAAAAVRKDAADAIEDIRRRGEGRGVNEILRSVRQALRGALPEAASFVLAGNREQAEAILNETTRSSLLLALQDQLGNFERDIFERFSTSLESLASSLADEQNKSGLGDVLQQQIREHIPEIQQWLRDKIGDKGGGKISDVAKLTSFTIGSRTAGVMTAGILGSAANIVAPVLGLVVAFLPEILGALFGAGEEDRQKLVMNKLEGEVLPGILNKIRRGLPARLAEQSEGIVERVAAQFEKDITLKEAAVENARQSQERDRAEITQKEAKLAECKKEVSRLLNSLL